MQKTQPASKGNIALNILHKPWSLDFPKERAHNFVSLAKGLRKNRKTQFVEQCEVLVEGVLVPHTRGVSVGKLNCLMRKL
jgi:hypothetical protein